MASYNKKSITVIVNYNEGTSTDLGTYNSLLNAWAATNQVIEHYICNRSVSDIAFIPEEVKENGNG